MASFLPLIKRIWHTIRAFVRVLFWLSVFVVVYSLVIALAIICLHSIFNCTLFGSPHGTYDIDTTPRPGNPTMVEHIPPTACDTSFLGKIMTALTYALAFPLEYGIIPFAIVYLFVYALLWLTAFFYKKFS